MSYARMGPDADIYVFLSTSGEFECCGCRLLEPRGRSATFDRTDALLEHLDAHEAAGHAVPDRCRERLIERRDENDASIAAASRDSQATNGDPS